MKNIKTILLSSIFAFNLSCNQQVKKEIKGKLAFESISFLSLYGSSDNQYKEFLIEMENGKSSDNNKKDLYTYFSKLKKHNILRNPYIFLEVEKDSIITVYLNEDNYEKVKNYNYSDLYFNKEKVLLKLLLEEKEKNIYYSDSILSVEKIKYE